MRLYLAFLGSSCWLECLVDQIWRTNEPLQISQLALGPVLKLALGLVDSNWFLGSKWLSGT